ncbi:MAG: hypothetical protein EOO43_17155, partial [Flavobacterium sp.]
MRLPNFQTSSFKVAINLANRVITALIGLICVPIYVRLIGIESYGLVAFYATLVGALVVLDLGLSTAISRQVAIFRAKQGSEEDMKDLVFSVEVIYWGLAILVGILLILLAEPISLHWVKAKSLPTTSIKQAVVLMGVIFAFQFPYSIYDGILVGLERQVPNAIISLIFSAVKALGVIIALKFFSSTVECYFLWQAIVTLIFTLVIRYFVKKYLPSTSRPSRFSKKQLIAIWRFAIGMVGISLISFFLGQADKIVVSKM